MGRWSCQEYPGVQGPSGELRVFMGQPFRGYHTSPWRLGLWGHWAARQVLWRPRGGTDDAHAASSPHRSLPPGPRPEKSWCFPEGEHHSHSHKASAQRPRGCFSP